jgi:FkbM family methyltransferase
MTDSRDQWQRHRQSWFGLKKYVKTAAGFSIPHAILRAASRYVPRLRSGRLPAPRGLAEVRGEAAGAVYVMLRPDRCEIAKELYWGGGKRPRPEDQFALESVVRLAREADVFIDIGAYTGVFSLATASGNPSLQVRAFEIVPAVSDLLVENIRRNGVEDRVIVHREGIGVPGAKMTIPMGDEGSALPSFYSSRMHFEDGVTVAFRSLDSLRDLLTAGQRVVMKIDVEGTEANIFRHGTDFLKTFEPDILCEVLHGRAEADALDAILRSLGYRLYLVRSTDVVMVDSVRPHPRFRDWLFTRRDDMSLSAAGISVAT